MVVVAEDDPYRSGADYFPMNWTRAGEEPSSATNHREVALQHPLRLESTLARRRDFAKSGDDSIMGVNIVARLLGFDSPKPDEPEVDRSARYKGDGSLIAKRSIGEEE